MINDERDDILVSRTELQKVADFLPYPFIIAEVIDGVHYNTFLNEIFLQEIGYTRDEVPTIETWYEKAYPDPEYRKFVIAKWNEEQLRCQSEGIVSVKRKSLVTCKNNTTRWFEVKASVIDKVHVVAFVDLDKEIRLQEELKKINENNDRMLSILGHDLRGPVANLLSISSMAINSDISQDEFAILSKMMHEQSTHVLDLLDNTLNWAKLNFDDIKPISQKVNLTLLVETILDLYKAYYQSKGITIGIDSENSELIESDPEILTVIIRNLVSNAIKFTPQNGAIKIRISKDKVSVIDNGIGISSSMIYSIKNNDYTSRAGTDNESGIGIGLQLVINLAEKIDAYLDIQSEEFKGTSMSIHFSK